MNGTNDGGWGGGQGAPGGQPQPYPGMSASGGSPPGGGQGGGPYGSPPGGGNYGGPPGGGGFGGAPPPGGGGFGAPPGGGGFGQPPGGGGFGQPPGGGFGGPPGGGFGGPPGGGGFGGPPGGGGFGQPPGGGFGGPPGGYGNPPPYVPQVPGQSISGNGPIEPLAIGSFIVGLISVPGSFCCSFLSIPLSLVAIVTGIVAFGKARQRNDQLGKLFAISGIGTGAVGVVLLIVFMALGMAGALFGQMR